MNITFVCNNTSYVHHPEKNGCFIYLFTYLFINLLKRNKRTNKIINEMDFMTCFTYFLHDKNKEQQELGAMPKNDNTQLLPTFQLFWSQTRAYQTYISLRETAFRNFKVTLNPLHGSL